MSASVLRFPSRAAAGQVRIDERLSPRGAAFGVTVITNDSLEPLGEWTSMGDAFRVAQHAASVRNLPIGLAIFRGAHEHA